MMKLYNRLFGGLCLIIVFFMPVYGRILPPLISLLVLVWLFGGNYKKRFQTLLSNRKLFLFSTVPFYLLHLIGMLYSKNQHFGWFDLEVKLSLIVFPLIFFSSPPEIFSKAFYRNIFLAFITGCLVTTIFFTCRAEINFLQSGDMQSLYYIFLGWYFHPTYLSMYFVFSLVMLSGFLVKEGSSSTVRKRTLMVLLMLLFMYFIFMLSSKAGMFTMFAVLGIFILYWVKKSGQILQALGIVILLTGFFVMLYRTFPLALERMEEAGQAAVTDSVPPDANGSTSARLNTWKTAVAAISDNLPFGVGTGDVKDELMRRYRENHNTYAIVRQLNAHSQYLQSLVVLGIPGFILLLGMLFYPLQKAIRKKDLVISLFLFLIISNMLIESLLETQAGTIFYGFFNSLFLMQLFMRDTGHGTRNS